MNRKFTIAWLVLIGAALVLEVIGFFSPGQGDTLSFMVWTFLGGGFGRYLLLGGAFAWLVVHFFWLGKKG